MLCYGINRLDALDKLKEADCCFAKEEASRKPSKNIVLNPYNFSLPRGVILNSNMLAFIKA